MQQVTILGGGYAGILAALRLQRKAEVTLISREATFGERVRFHEMAAGERRTYPIAAFLRGTGVRFLQAGVTGIDPNAQRLTTTEGMFSYETLIYALGSSTDRNSVPGVRQYAYTLDSDHLGRLNTALRQGGSLVICGGGLTGIEAAAEFAEAFPAINVTLLTRGVVGEGLSEKGRAYLRAVFQRLGITLREHTGVTRVTADEVLTEEGRIGYDHLLWAGAFTVPTLAREAGIAVNERGQVRVDSTLRSISHRAIFAVGDSAALDGIRMGCVTAMPMGAHAASNILRRMGNERPFRFAYPGQNISLGRRAGLIQLTRADDTPRERILTGRVAALIKEAVCRFTTAALRVERRFPGAYQWLRATLPSAQPEPTEEPTELTWSPV
ncbi:MAG TPA: FAD-dependent oxidoreductase [Aggregatilineales bacterium]|nr:FAD-dependent oxidoreductase [Aggregatilineales bacterium]